MWIVHTIFFVFYVEINLQLLKILWEGPYVKAVGSCISWAKTLKSSSLDSDFEKKSLSPMLLIIFSITIVQKNQDLFQEIYIYPNREFGIIHSERLEILLTIWKIT